MDAHAAGAETLATDSASSRLERYVALERASGPYVDWQLEQFRPYLGRRILEIGCGVGEIIERLGACERVHGIDVAQELVDHCRSRFAGRREFTFSVGDVASCREEDLEELRRSRFDTIVCLNVLEHIRDDVAALRAMERILEPAGRVALLVPAHRWLYGPWDNLEGHYRRYTKRSLRDVIRQTAWRAVNMHYFNCMGALGWWFHYRLLRREAHTARQFRSMNRLIPLLRPIERVVSPPFGLSLIAVLQKP